MSTSGPRPLAALSPDGYPIPTATISRQRVTLLMSISLAALFGWLAYRAAQDTGAVLGHDHEALLWTALMLTASHQTLIAWFDKPYTVTAGQRAALAGEKVHVSVPLYNESPEIVDRVMLALSLQTLLPYRIVVVDDGTTKYDYGVLREFWVARFAELGVLCEWHRQANAGKRHAQAVAFRTARDGFMVTLDSDTALEAGALEEIVKPFADARVWSVAGLELAYNQTRNLLTRINGMRQLSWQMVQCAALNRWGGILVNRGTFAAYRAVLTYETVDAYVAEMFLGKPVKYSDDSLLTLYALGRGRAVQQVSAHQFSEYAETVSHALRQWTRWMRGATIRSVWRARYLPLNSYAGFINYLNWWQLIASSAAYVYVGVVLPIEGRASLSAISAAVGASYLANVRTLLIKRDDQDGVSQLDTWLLSPLAWAWSLLVLRPIRAYAIFTCTNNGWGTRAKIEVGEFAGQYAPAPPAATAFPPPAPARPTLAGSPAWANAAERRPVGEERLAPTEIIPVIRARPRPSHRRRAPMAIRLLAFGVTGVAVAVVGTGLALSLHSNVIAPTQAPARVRVAARPSQAVKVGVPVAGRSSPPAVVGGGAGIEPAARVSTLPAPSPAASASASVTSTPAPGGTPAHSAAPIVLSSGTPFPSMTAASPASPQPSSSGSASPSVSASASSSPSPGISGTPTPSGSPS